MRILHVVHGFPPEALGGTEIYVRDLARAQAAAGDEVFVLTRESTEARPELTVRRTTRDGVPVITINNTFRACRSFEDGYRHPALAALATRLVRQARPDVVHVHHLTCLSTELLASLARHRVPVVMTLNDYWLFCHRGQLLDLDGAPCAAPAGSACDRCVDASAWAPAVAFRLAAAARGLAARLPHRVGRAVGASARRVAAAVSHRRRAAEAMAARAAHMRAMARHVACFLMPSRTMRERALAFGLPAEKLLDQTQGIDTSRFGPARSSDGAAGGGRPLSIGFVGSLMLSKAPHVLLEAFAALPSGRATLTVAGGHAAYHGDDRYRDRVAPLLRYSGVRHLGAVAHDIVNDVFAALDILVVPSVWLENAPFVIREAFAAGVPVVASRLGGMAEMVRDGVDGLLFMPGDAADLARVLRRLLDEPELLGRLRSGLPRVRTIAEDAAWTRDVYQRVLAAPRPAGARPRLAAVVVHWRTPDETLLTVRALAASRRPIDDLIVVDNGSGDLPAARIAAAAPGVRIITAGVNLGFSGGTNLGVRGALGAGGEHDAAPAAERVLLINSDAIVPPDAIERLEAALESDETAGIVAPALLARSAPETVTSLGIEYDTRTGRMRQAGFGRSASEIVASAHRVDAVSGCVMLVKADVFDRIGLLADEYFFSFEDLDFCLRARRAGFSILLAGDAVAYHEGGRSIGARSPRRHYFATRNHLLLARRAGAAAPAVLRVARNGAIVLLNLAHATLRGGSPVPSAVAAVLRGAWDHARGRYGAGPHLS
jgi:GT2 family glycosyltransferase/glycosyltransferase involved in cell wall biosynthesis